MPRFGLYTVVLVLLMCGLAGCAGTPDPASLPAAGTGGGAAKLKVWIEFSDNPQLFQETFARYAAENDMQVEVVCPAPQDKILAALSSSDGPDIVVLSDFVVAQSIAFRGLTLDLKELGAQGGIDFDDIYPATLVACQQGSKLACLPWGGDVMALYWNKDLFEIVLPLAKPALVVVAITTFLFHWNDFQAPMIYLTSPENFTMALGMADFEGQRQIMWNLLMAAAVVFTLPIIIAFFFAQKQFVEGIKLTGMKD